MPEFFSRPFQLFPAPTNCPWVSEDGVGRARKCFLFSYRWSRRCRGFILKHVVSRWSRKGRKMWGFSPLSTLLLFSIFIAVHSEEKQDVRKGAIVRARLEVCSGPYFLDRMKAYCGSCILFSLYSSYWY